jgi:hypothetical protein
VFLAEESRESHIGSFFDSHDRHAWNSKAQVSSIVSCSTEIVFAIVGWSM